MTTPIRKYQDWLKHHMEDAEADLALAVLADDREDQLQNEGRLAALQECMDQVAASTTEEE